MKQKILGYTLAEVLTTLLVIGVVAVITMPVLINGIYERVLEGQNKTFNSKFNDVLHLMQIKGALAKHYDSTGSFVESMKKYGNIVKVCDSNSLNQCFPSKFYQSKSELKFSTANLHKSDDMEASFYDEDIVGIVFADGTSAIIAYNSNCMIENKYEPTADLTECMAVIYDVNGSGEGPNMVGSDIGMINIGVSPEEEEFELFAPSGLSVAECNTFKEEHSDLISGCLWEPDTWAYSIKYCEDKGMKLISPNEIQAIAKEIYNSNEIPLSGEFNGEVKNNDVWKKYFGDRGEIWIWTSGKYSDNQSYARKFEQNKTWVDNSANRTSTWNFFGLCVKK